MYVSAEPALSAVPWLSYWPASGCASLILLTLLRCVGIDRSFYRPLTEGQYARYAGQVPDDFRFVV